MNRGVSSSSSTTKKKNHFTKNKEIEVKKKHPALHTYIIYIWNIIINLI